MPQPRAFRCFQSLLPLVSLFKYYLFHLPLRALANLQKQRKEERQPAESLIEADKSSWEIQVQQKSPSYVYIMCIHVLIVI